MYHAMVYGIMGFAHFVFKLMCFKVGVFGFKLLHWVFIKKDRSGAGVAYHGILVCQDDRTGWSHVMH